MSKNAQDWRMQLLGIKGDNREVQIVQNMYRRLSNPLAKILAKTSVTPNQLTVLNALFGVAAGICFSFGLHSYLIVGSFLLHLSLLFDYADGRVAKLKNQLSAFGDWLDGTLDRVVDFCVILGIIVGIYNQLNHPLVWIAGAIFLGMRFLIDSSYVSNLSSYPFLIEAYKETKNSKNLIMRVAKQFIYTRTSFLFLATVFALLNQLFLYVMIMSVYSCLWFLALMVKFGMSIRVYEKRILEKDCFPRNVSS